MTLPTPKQSAARTRNWRVFQLRGLYTRMFWLTGERLEQAKALVEAELRAMGAQTMAEQRAALSAKWEAMDK
jgi:hypothetical protein